MITENISQSEKENIAHYLNSNRLNSCSVCGNYKFSVIDGYIRVPLYGSLSGEDRSMSYCGLIGASCDKCGNFIMLATDNGFGTLYNKDIQYNKILNYKNEKNVNISFNKTFKNFLCKIFGKDIKP